MIVKTNANYSETLVFKNKPAVPCKFPMVSLGQVDNANRNSSYEPRNIKLQTSPTLDILNFKYRQVIFALPVSG